MASGHHHLAECDFVALVALCLERARRRHWSGMTRDGLDGSSAWVDEASVRFCPDRPSPGASHPRLPHGVPASRRAVKSRSHRAAQISISIGDDGWGSRGWPASTWAWWCTHADMKIKRKPQAQASSIVYHTTATWTTSRKHGAWMRSARRNTDFFRAARPEQGDPLPGPAGSQEPTRRQLSGSCRRDSAHASAHTQAQTHAPSVTTRYVPRTAHEPAHTPRWCRCRGCRGC